MRVAEPLDPLRRQLPGQRVAPRRSGSRCRAPATSRISSRRSIATRPSCATISPATSASRAPVRSIQLDVRDLPHPGELAAGVVARALLHRLDVAGEQLVEAERLARGARGAGLGAPRLLGAPAATIASTRASIRSSSSSRSMSARRSGRVAQLGDHSCRVRGGGSIPAARARSSARSACGRSGGRRGELGASSACSASGPRSAISRSTSSRISSAPAGAARGRPARRAGRGRSRRPRSAAGPPPAPRRSPRAPAGM